MALEDFERELLGQREHSQKRKRGRDRSLEDGRGKRRHQHRHHHSSRHHGERDSAERRSHKQDKRKQQHDHDDGATDAEHSRRYSSRSPERHEGDQPEKETSAYAESRIQDAKLSRDSWMEAPSAIDIEYVHHQRKQEPKSAFVEASGTGKAGEGASVRKEIETHSQDASRYEASDLEHLPAQHDVDYTFGDAGASWRMTKLKAVFKQADESSHSIEEVATRHYGDLRAFDDAREEERELGRRLTLGKGYVGIDKPSGELFQERKLASGLTKKEAVKSPFQEVSEDEFESARAKISRERQASKETVQLDQTALNRLKAQLMKAKLSKSADLGRLQAEYEEAMSVASRSHGSDVVVLNKMENRSLAGTRQGEVKAMDSTKRGRERGHVEENEDMSIADMVRQERRTKFQNDGNSFAERISKDAKFNNDLDYMDDNAAKLAKSVQKSDISLRNVAVNEYQKMKRILDTCQLCSHEDTGTPPLAPVVSLAMRTYLTLPTAPEITPYGYCASVVPVQHRANLLECDDDEWEEIRNFMKSLTRFYYNLKPSRHVIFYENAAHEGRKRHASLEAIPLPMKYADTASQFFKEAILSSDEEWSQHRKLIDTLRKAEDGAGKQAFRKTMVSELPYFHVWFRLDGGYGHVIEDSRRWPKGDLFAREIIGGMLDVGPEIIKRQGRWRKGDIDMERRVKDFRSRWENFDWTQALMEAD